MALRDPRLRLWEVPEQRDEVFGWVDARLAEHAAERRPVAPVVRIRPQSTTARFESSRGPVWFKAGAPGCRFEAGLLAALAQWSPDSALEPLGTDTARGWSLLPHAGPTLRDLAAPDDLARWEAMLAAYGELQRVLSEHVAAALALGLPDLRPSALGGWRDGFLADEGVRAALGERVLAALERDRPAFDADCAALADSGIPASIDHADLHTGNVSVVEGRFRFYDWGDATAAHPFTSLMVPLRFVERELAPPPHAMDRLRDAYLEPWTAHHRRAHLDTTLDAARRLGAVGRALAWSRTFPELADRVGPRKTEQIARWMRYLVDPAESGAL